MYANMASLNAWRRSRGFSKSFDYQILGGECLMQTLSQCRHFCLTTSLWRSWRSRSLVICLFGSSLYLSWYLVAKSASSSGEPVPKFG